MRFEFVYPKGNETTYLEYSKIIGTKTICLTYCKDLEENYKTFLSLIPKFPDLALYFGIEFLPKNFSKIKFKKFKSNHRLGILNLANTNGDYRSFLMKQNINIIKGLEQHNKSDYLHQRNSNLNHILANIITENKKEVYVDFSQLLNTSDLSRSKAIGRIVQNIKIMKRCKQKLNIASFAKKPLELRNLKTLDSFMQNIIKNKHYS